MITIKSLAQRMDSLKFNQDIKNAECFGKEAFLNNKMRVPALDKRFTALLYATPTYCVGNRAEQLLDAWLKGWDKENLK